MKLLRMSQDAKISTIEIIINIRNRYTIDVLMKNLSLNIGEAYALHEDAAEVGWKKTNKS